MFPKTSLWNPQFLEKLSRIEKSEEVTLFSLVDKSKNSQPFEKGRLLGEGFSSWQKRQREHGRWDGHRPTFKGSVTWRPPQISQTRVWNYPQPFTHPFIWYGWGFPHRSVGKESACNAGDQGSIPGSGRSPGKGNGHLLQYSCLEIPMDRGAWRATVCAVMRVRHDLVTKPPPEPNNGYVSKVLPLFLYSQNQLNA